MYKVQFLRYLANQNILVVSRLEYYCPFIFLFFTGENTDLFAGVHRPYSVWAWLQRHGSGSYNSRFDCIKRQSSDVSINLEHVHLSIKSGQSEAFLKSRQNILFIQWRASMLSNSCNWPTSLYSNDLLGWDWAEGFRKSEAYQEWKKLLHMIQCRQLSTTSPAFY